MNHCIATIEEATPTWLTEILTRSGRLSSGKVRSLTVSRIYMEQLYSISYSLSVEYSSNASVEVPTRLFLKLPRADNDHDPADFARKTEREIRLYQKLMSPQPSLPIIPCYDACYDSDRRIYHLLLDDLSETHDQPSWHLTIADHYITQTIDSLAAFHMYWWEHPQLNNDLAVLPTATSLEKEIARLRAVFPHFVDDLGDQLSSEDQQVYDRLLTALPTLWEKRNELHGQTLVHGDPHFWNFLYPLDPNKHRTYMLDWQC